jgi:hypothetical protein
MPSQLIAFVGLQDSGKNTAAAALYPYGFIPLSFADAMKDSLAAIFCWDRAMLEGITTESRAWREQIDTWWAAKLNIPQFSPRWALRHFGTTVMRQHFHHDLWVFNVERRLASITGPVVLIDARFPNEIALARCYGARVVRVKRGADPEWMSLAMTGNHDPEPLIREYAINMLIANGIHESEFAWIGVPVDAMIENNGTVAQLHAAVITLIVERNNTH